MSTTAATARTTITDMTPLEAARHNLAHGLAQGWAPARINLLAENVEREERAAGTPSQRCPICSGSILYGCPSGRCRDVRGR